MRVELPERIATKIELSDSGCWLWTAFTNGDGYGKIWFEGMAAMAHRVTYEMLVGPIPDGLQIDHLCRVRNCVNPNHLEPVTSRTNSLRGDTFQAANAAKTHCPKGHEYTPDNLDPYCLKRGQRWCLTCKRDKSRKRARKQ